MNNWIYVDQALPGDGETVAVLVASMWESPLFDLYTDAAELDDEGNWHTWNDWDEGQPWAIIAWQPLPKMPNRDEISQHHYLWFNVKAS